MDAAEIAKIVVPALTGLAVLTGAVVKVHEGTGKRADIAKDLEVLKALPDESASAPNLLGFIDKRIDAFIEFEATASRQVGLGIFAVLGTLAMLGASLFLIGKGDWWLLGLVLTVVLGLVFAYGVGDSFVKAPRDESGNRIERDETS